MHLITRPLSAGALATLALAAVAHADRAGTGAVRNPHMVKSHHITFTLPGDSWAQLRGVLGGTPSCGSYVFASGPTPPIAPSGGIGVSVGATLVMRKPTVGAGNTLLLPGNNHTVVRVAHHGTNGPVRWWSGTGQSEHLPVGVAYQRAPRSLDPTGTRWLYYTAGVGLTDPAQRAKADFRRQAANAVLAIVRTVRLAPGPCTTSGPYAPAN
jgi:hypothetical protein